MTKRINFISVQMSHQVPTKYVQKERVRTGYERTLAHMVNRDYAGVAEKDGEVSAVYKKDKIIEVTYDDGTRDCFEYGQKYGEISGFCVTHDLVPVVSIGQKVHKGDLIMYNKGFFTYDKYNKQADFSTGILGNVAMVEVSTTNKDSSEISARLSEKMTMFPTNMRVIMLPKNAHIYQYKTIGESVLNTDPLVVFEEEDMSGSTKIITEDTEALAALSKLNRHTPEAKFNGTIVKIDAFYGCPIDKMHPTLAKIVKDAVSSINRKNKIAKGTEAEYEYPESGLMPEGSKYKGITFDENTICLIYYIRESIPQGRGDKLVLCNQMKNTVAGIFPKPVYTESGTEIDMFFSANCAAKRIVLSPLMHGIIARCVEKIEQDAVAIYNSKDSTEKK